MIPRAEIGAALTAVSSRLRPVAVRAGATSKALKNAVADGGARAWDTAQRRLTAEAVNGRQQNAAAAAAANAAANAAPAPDVGASAARRFPPPPLEPLRAEVAPALREIGGALVGRDRESRLALSCFLAGGHLLIDGPPGLGETTMAHALAAVIGAKMNRIQFTADLMPSDITGSHVFDREAGAFRFVPGPIFADLVLADEINRAPPRAQNALLEAMAERRVTIDGDGRDLADDIFVVATRNPTSEIGAFPLPESQHDRFLMRLEFSHLGRSAEATVPANANQPDAVVETPIGAGLSATKAKVGEVHLGDLALNYVQDLIGASREDGVFGTGLSIRTGLALISAAKAWTRLHGRDAVEPDDVQAVFAAVAAHRLKATGLEAGYKTAEAILWSVPVARL